MTKDLQIVGLRIGRETYGIPIALVREIVRVPEITAVPNTQEYVEGVINLRGKIVSVMDLRKRFGESNIESNKKNRIVVVEFEGRTVGLIVNSASEVLKLSSSEIAPPGSVFIHGEVDYVTGVAKLGERLIILLDLSKVLRRRDSRPVDQTASPIAAI
jgi:purine-binding chemotaxis protein CheW